MGSSSSSDAVSTAALTASRTMNAQRRRRYQRHARNKISNTCLLGTGHFLKCAMVDCCCVCHEMDGEDRHLHHPLD